MRKKHISLDNSNWALVRRLLRDSVRPYLMRILLALACMAVVAATTAVGAWLMDPTINRVFVERREDLLVPVASAVLAIFIVKGLAGYGQAVLLGNAGLHVVADLQQRLFAHLVRMDLDFVQAQHTGSLISRLTIDVYAIRTAVSTVLTALGRDALSVVFLVLVMVYQDWVLAAVSVVLFPILILPVVRFGHRMRRATANTHGQITDFATLLEQNVQGLRTVKAYGMEDLQTARAARLVRAVFKLAFAAARTRALSYPVIETLGGLAVSVAIVYGGSRVIGGETTAGAFFSFLAALMMTYQPMKSLAGVNGGLRDGAAAARRLFDLFDEPPTVPDGNSAAELAVRGGRVRLEGVFFTYDGEKTALDGITLDIPAGRTVALVGPAGAGKSTILNLIPRFYDITDGRITIDGTDIRDAGLAALRAKVALVGREAVLFDDTVRANLTFGRPGATDAEVEQAARTAAVHDFIAALPQGYDTMLGQHGVTLSAGQRQQLAIARAMLKNAPILLVDEATGRLDRESARVVQAALDRLMKGRTTIVVAHRLSTIVTAHLIHVVDRGRLVESGTHHELLERGGLYAHLYAMQAEQGADHMAAQRAGA